MTITEEPPEIVWGCCRDAGRWFWYARIIGGRDAHGWAPNRDAAARQANAAAVKLAAGRYAAIRIRHEAAEVKLAAVKAARRSGAQAGDRRHADAGSLYAIDFGYYDHGARQWVHSRVVRLPITKKTPRRIYYLRSSEPGEFEQGYIDRQHFEAHGWVWSSRYNKIYAEPPEVPEDKPFDPAPYRAATVPSVDEVKRLKAEMAAAHPDRGGTSEAFITARQRYMEARRRAV
ncbi:hypothetical protein ACIQCF_30125 [Streptomyces sp. NPDC088353]|uniref:hypothetical protein n=1 Tax=Streptomyces sp. NPDC088353 TaxID=3365855 RepID=UPI0037F8785E